MSTKVDSALETMVPELQGVINTSTASASVKAQAQADLNALNAKVTASQTSISGVTASVINLVPSGWPGNQTDLKNARQNITNAATDLDGARADITDILTLLG